MNLKEKAKQLKTDIPALFLSLKSKETPVIAKVFKYRKQAQGMWQNGKPKKWYYAIPIILIWLVILGGIVKIVLF